VSFLLDTNVVSELVKPQPDPIVVDWLEQLDEDRLYLSVVTLAELRYGIARLPAGRNRQRLHDWLQGELVPRFDRRILPVDEIVALIWGDVTAECAAAGRPIGAMDALIAATVRVHALELVTRDTEDFEVAQIPVRNPWLVSG
jgi:predicted nucleic acid-binding protein